MIAITKKRPVIEKKKKKKKKKKKIEISTRVLCVALRNASRLHSFCYSNPIQKDNLDKPTIRDFVLLFVFKWVLFMRVVRWFSSAKPIGVVFVKSGGEELKISGNFVGKNILEIAHQFDVELEGACDGSCACSTCHVILQKHVYDSLPPAKDEEEDMLDLAFGLTETSRLGCQVRIFLSLSFFFFFFFFCLFFCRSR
jgi:ferredoxin